MTFRGTLLDPFGVLVVWDHIVLTYMDIDSWTRRPEDVYIYLHKRLHTAVMPGFQPLLVPFRLLAMPSWLARYGALWGTCVFKLLATKLPKRRMRASVPDMNMDFQF